MDKFISLRNKCVKRFAQVCCLSTIGFVFQACYGMPQNERNTDKDIMVRVIDENENPLPDIEISVNDFIVKATNEVGVFYAFIPKNETYKIHIAGNELYHPRDTSIVEEGQRDISFSIKLVRK